MDDKKAKDLSELRDNAELYQALMKKHEDKVVDMCKRLPDGPLHVLTIHNDTVLHVAAYHGRNKLALRLLGLVFESHKLNWQNNGGNTALHETCTNNRTVRAALEMLRRAPMLLSVTNREGETPLCYAACHGKSKIFDVIHDEVVGRISGPDLKTFLRRDDKYTILHLAVLSRNYWIAHELAVKHPCLMYAKDGDEMTPLQLLSCNWPEFGPNGFFERMIYKWVAIDRHVKYKSCDPDIEDKNFTVPWLKSTFLYPWLEKVRKDKHTAKWAPELARVLIRNDTSWRVTGSRTNKLRTKYHTYGKSTRQEQILASAAAADGEAAAATLFRTPDTPLILATKHGCTEIVKEILRMFPQAVEHIDGDGRNILHVAIMYRRTEVMDAVDGMTYPKERLRGKIDNNGNSLLHMVGKRADDGAGGGDDSQSPAVVLRDDRLLFERVNKITRSLDSTKVNSEGKTADEVFAAHSAKLQTDAKQWTSDTARNCVVAAVLVAAAAAVAAAYTGDGDGLLYMVSLSLALTSLVVFHNTVVSPSGFRNWGSLVGKLWLGFTLLGMSVVLMMAAAATAARSGRWRWSDIVSFLPMCVFLVLYGPLYADLSKGNNLITG